MTDLDNARVWAEQRAHSELVFEGAAARLIQSLPDQWVDAEKVREIIENIDASYLSDESTGSWEDGHDEALRSCARALETLITPKLPTLADMTQEEREACKGMQANLGDSRVVINCVLDDAVQLMETTGWVSTVREKDFAYKGITPLPDLPKLEWPAQEPRNAKTPPAETLNNTSSETPRNPRPDDVIPNQPWLVEINGEKYVGTRFSGVGIFHPWAVAALDGSETFSCDDMAITLIHQLVAESPALPEGMRLADHEEYGRVVVAPRVNTHGDESFYRLGEDSPWGASHGYRPTEEFTFLGGEG